MTSAPVRDPLADHLLTPENAAFLQWDPSTAAMVAQTIGRTLQQFGVCDRAGWMQSSFERQEADVLAGTWVAPAGSMFAFLAAHRARRSLVDLHSARVGGRHLRHHSRRLPQRRAQQQQWKKW